MRVKNIKNKGAYILLILFIILSIIVVYIKISFDKSQKLYNEAVSNLVQIKNYSFAQKIDISYNNESYSKMVSGQIDEENLKYSYVYNDDVKVYGLVVDNNNYVFSKKENGSWLTIKSDYDMYSVRKLGKFLRDKKKAREVKSDIKSLTKF